MLFIHKAEIQRRQKIEGKGLTSTFAKIGSDLNCVCIPVSEKDALSSGMTYGQDYMVYFKGNADVKQGDKIIVNGLKLLVNGVADYSHFPNIGHINCSCSKDKD